MIAEAKLEANRANAQHSTGPRTPEGKAKVSRNAVKHGLTSKDVILRTDEDREEFTELQEDLRKQIQPAGALAEDLFRQLVHAAWSLRLARRAEVELVENSDCETNPLLNPNLAHQLEIIARYATRHERTYHKALKELRRLATDIEERGAMHEWSKGIEIEPLADAARIAKQTHQLARLSTVLDLHEDKTGGPAFGGEEDGARKARHRAVTPIQM